MRRAAAIGLCVALAAQARAAETGADDASRHALGTEFFYSSDSDDTEVIREALNLDLRNEGDEGYLGISLERARYNPQGLGWQSRDRIYARAADSFADWQWRARIGTDGETVLGSIGINDTSRYRKEFFVERDLVETREGLRRGLYSTFAGAAIDLPVGEHNILTAFAGVQSFTGDNVRLHLRGSYIHVARPDLGLSLQLRGRYFHSSDPREFDYYSPRWYAEILPVAQVRRFFGGWEVVGAAGLGVQRDSGTDWRQSIHAHARFRSPPGRRGWAVNGALTYTTTPPATGSGDGDYGYLQITAGVSRRF
ncbi:MAG TPA: hypothetical protein VF704_05045 [Allosphingosinicella sp.]